MAGSLSDVTERRDAEQRLIHDALHDALTGLPNRALFMDRLEQLRSRRARARPELRLRRALPRPRPLQARQRQPQPRGRRPAADRAGRAALERRPAPRRHGGAARRRRVHDPARRHRPRPRQALDVAARVRRRSPSRSTLRPAASCRSPPASASPTARRQRRRRRADPQRRHRDVRRQGSAGGGRCARLRRQHAPAASSTASSLETRAAARRSSSERLRTFFQPIVDLRTRRDCTASRRSPAGRADDAQRRRPPSSSPWPRTPGLIGPLGRLVLRSACQTLSRLARAGLVAPDVTVSVNVSRRQFTDGDLVDDVRAALDDDQPPAASLVLEITESTLMDEPGADAAPRSTSCWTLGVRVAARRLRHRLLVAHRSCTTSRATR